MFMEEWKWIFHSQKNNWLTRKQQKILLKEIVAPVAEKIDEDQSFPYETWKVEGDERGQTGHHCHCKNAHDPGQENPFIQRAL
jgi:hypothetical protein